MDTVSMIEKATEIFSRRLFKWSDDRAESQLGGTISAMRWSGTALVLAPVLADMGHGGFSYSQSLLESNALAWAIVGMGGAILLIAAGMRVAVIDQALTVVTNRPK